MGPPQLLFLGDLSKGTHGFHGRKRLLHWYTFKKSCLSSSVTMMRDRLQATRTLRLL